MFSARRNRRTDLDLVAAGDFVKVGRKHFRHVSGLEITYDGNRWSWRGAGQLWSTLEVAAHNVRLAAAASNPERP